MRTVTYRLVDLQNATLNLGHAGENQRTRIMFDAKKLFEEYPAALPSLTVKPPVGDTYPAVVTKEGYCVYWDITDSDLIHDGIGEAQLTFTENDVKVKTYITKTKITRSLDPVGQIPTPIENWIERADDILDEAQEAAAAAESAAQHQPKIENGYWYVWNGTEYVQNVKAQGEDGAPGQDGKDGKDGADGQPGADGRDGVDATPALITVDYEDLVYPVAAGTTCYHSGEMFVAKEAIQTAGAWDSSKWDKTTVEEQISRVLNAIGDQTAEIESITNKEKMMRIKLSANEIRIRYHYDGTNDLMTVWKKGENGNIRPTKTYKGSRELSFEELETSEHQIHSWSDSESPLQNLPTYTWWNMFSNHGYALPYITKSNHGKTSDDVGSIWQDTNGKTFTIVRVFGDSIYLAPKVTIDTDSIEGKTTRDWDKSYTITSLSHVSGAAHTDGINSFTQSFTQIYPTTDSNGIIVVLDGNITQATGEYVADRVDILQTMNCYDPATIPFSNISAIINLTNAEIMCYMTNAFTVVGGSVTYRATLNVKRPIYFGSAGRWGANQAIHPSPSLGETEYRFCPRCKNQDTPTQQKTDGTTGFIAKWNPTYLYDMDKPIDRMISYIVDENNNYKIGFASGLSLVSGDTKDENRSKYLTPDNSDGSIIMNWMGDDQNKGYFSVIDGSKFENGIIPAGTVCEVTSYFVYYNPDENIGQTYWYKDGDQWVIYIHCQTAQENIRVKLPAVMEGKEVYVVDKTEGAILKSTVISDGEIILSFVSDGTTLLKNWIVLKTKENRQTIPVDDVQINGVSILNDKIANIPYASSDNVGVVKVSSIYGLKMGDNGRLEINYADTSGCKEGSSSFKPITPYFQHIAVFYALAKAAGDTTQSASSDPVGTYTSDAKEKILKMLGIWDDISWVRTQH